MADDVLRELERRWLATGAIADEAALMSAMIRAGLPDAGGLTNELILAFVHRLILAGLNGDLVNAVLANNSTALAIDGAAARIVARMQEIANEAAGLPTPNNPFGIPVPEPTYEDQAMLTYHRHPVGMSWPTPEAQVEIWLSCYPQLDASHVHELAAGLLARAEQFPTLPGLRQILVLPKAGVLVSPAAADAYPYMPAARMLERDFDRIEWLPAGHMHLFQARVESPPEHTPFIVMHDALTPGDFSVRFIQCGYMYAGCSANRAEYLVRHNEPRAGWREGLMGLYEILGMLILCPTLWQTSEEEVLTEFVSAMPLFQFPGEQTAVVTRCGGGLSISIRERSHTAAGQGVPTWFAPDS